MAKKSIPRKTKSGKPAARRKAVKKNIPTPIVTNEELMEYYKGMLLMRRFEEKAGQMYGMGLIGGFCHLYIGPEAVVTGIQATLKEGDSVLTSYRDHAHMLACKIDPKLILAELTGRATGISKGKGGSMHMFSVEHGFYGGHGIVGAQVPIGAGLAFAHKYRKNDNVSVTYFGDGAVNQGQVYESFNMLNCGIYPLYLLLRIINMPWEHQLPDHRQRLSYSGAGKVLKLKANVLMVWTFLLLGKLLSVPLLNVEPAMDLHF